MKRSYVPVVLLLAVLMLNIIFTQYMVHQYFYEHYSNSLMAAIINVILFPVAFFIYKKGVNVHD
jgi:multisubunit Na+/H+ antiporter MnhB subunit